MGPGFARAEERFAIVDIGSGRIALKNKGGHFAESSLYIPL